MAFTEKANKIFNQAINDYHVKETLILLSITLLKRVVLRTDFT